MKDWNRRLADVVVERFEGFAAALKRCRASLSANSVHAGRVESRRLLSCLELVQAVAPVDKGYARARSEIRSALQWLQPLRDAQVQQRTLRRCSTAGNPPPLQEDLEQRLKQSGRDAARGLRRLRNGRIRNYVRRVERHLRKIEVNPGDEAGLRARLVKQVAAAHRLVIARRKVVDPGNVETIHRVRVAYKKFRYMAEPVQALLGDFPEATRQSMKALQDRLGELQDTEVFLARVDKLIQKDPSAARALALFRYWLLRVRPPQIRESLRLIDRLPAEWPDGPFLLSLGRKGGAPPRREGQGANSGPGRRYSSQARKVRAPSATQKSSPGTKPRADA